jgi:hypothetical protein
MNAPCKLAITATMLGLICLANFTTGRADEAPTLIALQPRPSLEGAATGRQFLLSTTIGANQAVSYFQNDNGRCKVTVMIIGVSEAALADSGAVRLQVVLDVGEAARMDSVEGTSLEFTCRDRAQLLTVRIASNAAAQS